MKKTLIRKLSLRREAVRILIENEIKEARAGAGGDGPACNSFHESGCTAVMVAGAKHPK